MRSGATLLVVASAIEGGALLRVAGFESEEVTRVLREQLGFLAGLLGDDPWARKW